MAKEKSVAQLYVADGAGGMRAVSDLRFESGEWPIELSVSAEKAEQWMAHLGAEVEERAWLSSAMGQLAVDENSGTLSIHTTSGQSPPSIDMIWEKQRGGDLHIQARPSGNPVLPLEAAREFIQAVRERQRLGKTLRSHCSTLLKYEGLPWRGELWLDSSHRLGPPSKPPEFQIAQQKLTIQQKIVVVDAMIEGIGTQGVQAQFQRRSHELCVFLSVVLGLRVRPNKLEYGWVTQFDSQGQFSGSEIRYLGYYEATTTPGFPAPGAAPPIERRSVTRPGLGPFGIWPDMQEQWVPADIETLWNSYFAQLPDPKREQFLQAGNAYLIARSMWPDQRTAYAAFLVVAIEALKPRGKRYDRLNVYDVVASLVSVGDAQSLRELYLHPQKIRSDHFHRGKLSAGELLPMFVYNYFADPSFEMMLRDLANICRLCLIEWLRCEGNYRVVRLPHEKRSFTAVMALFLARAWSGLKRALSRGYFLAEVGSSCIAEALQGALRAGNSA